ILTVRFSHGIVTRFSPTPKVPPKESTADLIRPLSGSTIKSCSLPTSSPWEVLMVVPKSVLMDKSAPWSVGLLVEKAITGGAEGSVLGGACSVGGGEVAGGVALCGRDWLPASGAGCGSIISCWAHAHGASSKLQTKPSAVVSLLFFGIVNLK